MSNLTGKKRYRVGRFSKVLILQVEFKNKWMLPIWRDAIVEDVTTKVFYEVESE